MIQGFGETIHNLADNSVKVFQEFEPKDLLDIDRKWDRKMEGQMKANKQFIVGTIAFLNYEMALRSGNSFASLFLGDGMKEAMTKTPLGTRAFIAQMAVPVHSYRTIPAAALQRASEAIATCGLVCAQAHSTSKQDPSMSQEQADFQKIENSLTNPAQTYEDAREMGAMIDMKRQEIATQTTQLQQTYALLQADIARMILNEQENYAKQSEDMSLSLKAISKGETLGTLEEQMKKVEAQ
jgi:hypothetical protein